MKLIIWKTKKPGLAPQWFWHVVASNGRKLAWSGEGYNRRSTMVGIIKKLFPQAYNGGGNITIQDVH